MENYDYFFDTFIDVLSKSRNHIRFNISFRIFRNRVAPKW
jgi:hypothetical protein